MNIMPQLLNIINAKIWDHTYFYEEYPTTAAGLWGTLGFPGLSGGSRQGLHGSQLLL